MMQGRSNFASTPRTPCQTPTYTKSDGSVACVFATNAVNASANWNSARNICKSVAAGAQLPELLTLDDHNKIVSSMVPNFIQSMLLFI